MEIQSPGLAAQLAQLHTAALAQPKCAWVPAALHALIMACLTRIFGRLEQLVLLWQSGDLPSRQIPTASSRTCAPVEPCRRPHGQRASRRAISVSRRVAARPRRAGAMGSRVIAVRIGRIAPRAAMSSPTCPNPARAPPHRWWGALRGTSPCHA